MANFSQWFIEFFRTFLTDIWNIIKGFFISIYNIFIGFPIKHTKEFFIHAKTFNFFEWFLSLIFVLVFVTILIMIFIVVFQLVRKYIHFTKIETDKIELLNRINIVERANKNRPQSFDSKNRLKPSLNLEKKQVHTPELQTKRFARLNFIDEKYKFTVLPTFMTDSDKLSLSQIVTHFRNYSAHKLGLYYDERTVSIFIAGMATSKLMILEGISGTGKTSLPYAFGKFINNDSTIISVQPSWRDRFEMMGYLNEFTKKFNETEFLRAIYESAYRTDINVIVLDEMNLARVEYYFADFLSLLELPNSDEWVLDIVPETIKGDPINIKQGKLKIPENLWFIGTANKDDSTFTITDKVYDRAASIEMNSKAVVFEGVETPELNISYKYLTELFEEALSTNKVSEHILDALEKIDDVITKNFEITFGNRIMKQLLTFIPVYVSCGRDEIEAIDYLVSRKILRKFETLNLPFLRRELEELSDLFDKHFGKDKMVDSKEMLRKYISQF